MNKLNRYAHVIMADRGHYVVISRVAPGTDSVAVLRVYRQYYDVSRPSAARLGRLLALSGFAITASAYFYHLPNDPIDPESESK